MTEERQFDTIEDDDEDVGDTTGLPDEVRTEDPTSGDDVEDDPSEAHEPTEQEV